jgi:DNA-binding transcriptional ArsR family regulator
MDEPSAAETEPQQIRSVDDVEVLKAMADPIRLAILTALMKAGGELPIMSVKELAAELGEPQTKLYRHIRQLEAVGLIRVAATRLVSGIVEQRYQACQRDVTFGRGFLGEHPEGAKLIAENILDRFRDGFFAAYQKYHPVMDEIPAEESYRKPLMFFSDAKLAPAKAAELRNRLEEIIEYLKDERPDPDGVPLNLMLGYYVEGDPADR